ncbi:MAG TPA: D-2-hydroxyacid dehydrogenase [Thermoanaerobaculia bacterium]|nr:D-2-hydroxyacid dehydrogenase [Thermoanaerobaculia bacterium]
MRLLVIAPDGFAPLEVLGREAGDVELFVGSDAETLRRDAARADAVLIAPRAGPVLTELWRELGNVRWVHTLAAGVEFLPFDLLRRSEIVVTNGRGLYADALGEFAIAAMLWFAKDLRRLVRSQEGRRWEPFTVERLAGQSVGIIGYGGIGRAVGARAAALGMHVTGVGRRQERIEPTIDDVIPRSDYVVLSTPLTPDTYRLFSRERIARMKPSAVLINVGRGKTVDEAALVGALESRSIRGAALDVFEHEPLPPEHPLWRLDNVLLSPHTADHTSDSHARAMQFFLENLRRFRAGEPLLNVVDKVAQY